ncbi:MAG: hypothetical protein QMD32_01830 [Smithellaceae bacterium]|nr:hypothetical protein [Smithellaceae bacterium]
MGNLFKIALRNLVRYKRRSLLTASLITVGVVFVLVFISVSGSFKNMMIGQITDSMLGHLQVHRKGFVASIETLPLNLNLQAAAIARLEDILDKQPEIEAYSPRIKFGGMFSNFTETASIRLTAIYPEKEYMTVPLLPERVIEGSRELKPGGILVPELLARGHEGEARRYGGHRGHQRGRLGERQAVHRDGGARQRHRPGRAGRLPPSG